MAGRQPPHDTSGASTRNKSKPRRSGSAQPILELPSGEPISLIAWAEQVIAPRGQAVAKHHQLLLQKLDRVTRGDIDRLLILMPPGSAK